MSVLKALVNKRRLSQIIIVIALAVGIFIYINNETDQHKVEIIAVGDTLPDIKLLDLNGEETTVQAAINHSVFSETSPASESYATTEASATSESYATTEASATSESYAVSETSAASTPMLINLWASWCKPCVNELPLLNEAQAFAPEVKFVAINMNEKLERIEPFIERYDLTMTMLRDEQLSWKQVLAAQGYPVTVLVDRNGVIQHIHSGAYTSIEEILQHTSMLVKGQDIAS